MAGVSPLPRSFSPSATTARQRHCIELMSLGRTAAQIAAEMGGITENGARKLMKRALMGQAAELLSADAFARAAALYLLHHDAMMQAWFPRAVGTHPDKDAADVALKLMNLFADVYGLKTINIQPLAPVEEGSGRVGADVVQVVLARLQELSDRQQPPAIEATVAEVLPEEAVSQPVTS